MNGTITPGGAPVTITLASGEVGRLTFTGTAGQRVFTKFTGITIGSGCYQTVDAAILDSGGGTVASKSWLCTNGDYLETVQLPSEAQMERIGQCKLGSRDACIKNLERRADYP